MKTGYKHDDKIVEVIRGYMPDIKTVYRYGSAGTVYEREDSDIDIALLGKKELTFTEISDLYVALTKETGREIDLHDLSRLPVTLKLQIVMNGHRLYCSNRQAAESYDTCVLSDYVRLNEERQAILFDIGKRGQIYG